MPYATNEGVRIHYEVEGSGPPLVLHHGYSNRLETWYERGYVGALKAGHRLILMDARGHGQSDKPHDKAAYGYSHMTSDVVAVLDAVGADRTAYFGYSMGGRIGWALATYAPDRISAFILGGNEPYAKPAEATDVRIARMKRRMEETASLLKAKGRTGITEADARFLDNDVDALLAAQMAFRDEPGLDAVLSTISVPCLVFVGEADELNAWVRVQEAAQQIPNATFFSLPGLDHGQAFARSDLVLPKVTKFLADLNSVTA